jgi:hypothetical protein
MTEVHHPREVSVLALIPKGSTTGAIGATAGALTHNDVMAFSGFSLAVLGFLVNAYFAWRKDQRDAALHLLQVSSVKSEKSNE